MQSEGEGSLCASETRRGLALIPLHVQWSSNTWHFFKLPLGFPKVAIYYSTVFIRKSIARNDCERFQVILTTISLMILAASSPRSAALER